jgi:elongation factor 1-alpha
MHLATSQTAATISELVAKIDPRTGQPTEERPKTLKTGDSAIVKITPLRPIVAETFKEYPELGRFALRDSGSTVAAGIIQQVTQKGSAEKTAAKA